MKSVRPALLPALLLASSIFATSGCARNPVTGDTDFVLLSENEEIRLGGEYHRRILKQYQVYHDPGLQRYVDDLGQTLAARSHRQQLQFTFTVLDSPEVNAFALPGGYIYITRGIMAYLNSEAELAGVIGHEIGHVTARHSVRQHSQNKVAEVLGNVTSIAAGTGGNIFGALGQALTSGYGRDHELEADRLGAQYLARVGYRPENMIEVIGVLKDQEEFEKASAEREGRQPRTYHGVFASHPRNDERLREVIRAAEKLAGDDVLPNRRNAYLEHTDGMIYGPSENLGVVRGNQFLHAQLGVGISAPEQWNIHNFARYLALIPEDRKAFVQLEVTGTRAGGKAQTELLSLLGAERLNAQRRFESGFDAFTGTGLATTPFGDRTTRFVAWVVDDNLFMFVAAAEQENRFADYDRVFLEIAASFRSLTDEEREQTRPLRLKIVAAPSGGYRALAKQVPLDNAIDHLRLLNGHYPDAEPTPGQRVKTVSR